MFLVLFGFPTYMLIQRGKYKNKKNAGAFFFENNQLVLNTGIPYPIDLENIEYVELKYNPWEVEHKLSYVLIIKVIKKDGKKKTVFYKGFKTAKLARPIEMIKALEEKNIRCVTKE